MRFVSFALLVFLLSGCASSKELKYIAEARTHFEKSEYLEAKTALLRPEVAEVLKNRVLLLLNLGTAAYAQGSYAEAIYFFSKARDKSNELRSSWSLFQGVDYAGNPIEFSWIHGYLALSFYKMSKAGISPAYTIPEVKDGDEILIPAENVAANTFSNRDKQDLLLKARSEILAWDTHLQTVSRAFSNPLAYKDDAYARVLGIMIHSEMNVRSDQHIAEALLKSLPDLLKLQSPDVNSDLVTNGLQTWTTKKNKNNRAVLVESGILDPLKNKKVIIGLSTLFRSIKDPQLRMLMERIGLEVILHTAPEFGLVLVGGAIFGAVSEQDDEPLQFTDAIDRGLGFQIDFPWMMAAPVPKNVEISFDSQSTKYKMTTLFPLQNYLHSQYQVQKDEAVFQKALLIGAQYLAILIPAIQAWRAVDGKEGSGLRKLGILAGYMFAKRLIDNANEADLRSWNWLPKNLLFGTADVAPGDYQAHIRFEEDGHIKQFTQSVKVNKSDRVLFFKKPTMQIAP